MISPQLIAQSIPSPAEGVWHLGPFPLRAYALCIVIGVIVAIWVGEKRWVAKGGRAGEVSDIALWMVPFGLIGGRLYHVITDWQLYFGEGRDPITALYVWRGGLGIWGAIALGAVGAIIGARRAGIRVLPFMDALAPGVILAQAIGRWGNYFNQELFGKPTDLPWALEIDAAHRPASYLDQATYHPTFLYESLWSLAAFALLIWADKRFTLGYGRMVAAYVAAYTAGRFWIENLRIDTVQMNDVLGMRLNAWTSLILFVAAVGYLIWSFRTHPGMEPSIYRDGFGPEEAEPEDAVVEDAEPSDAEPSDAEPSDAEPGGR